MHATHILPVDVDVLVENKVRLLAWDRPKWRRGDERRAVKHTPDIKHFIQLALGARVLGLERHTVWAPPVGPQVPGLVMNTGVFMVSTM